MNKSLHLLAAQDEVDFWRAVRQGRGRAARARAASLCSLPHHTGAVEMDVRCAAACWGFRSALAFAQALQLSQGELTCMNGAV